MFRQPQTSVAALGPATPQTIMGANLVGWWTADRGVTDAGGGAVSSWVDRIGGYDLTQASAGARPTWSAASFNGRPGVSFDGGDDHLGLESVPPTFPTGSASSEVWVVCSQDLSAATATNRCAFGYGTDGGPFRLLNRSTSSGTNRAFIHAQNSFPSNLNIDFSGRHYVRGIFVNGGINCHVDGLAGAVGTPTLATSTTRVRMGSNLANTPSGFFGGVIHEVFILDTQPSAGQITSLNEYCAAKIA